MPRAANNGSADTTINLGNASNRFKDLHLSGDVIAPNIVASNGVFLGGTSNANKLDDYEGGTWTPVVGSGTYTASYARYTKIGRRVFIDCRIELTGTRTTASFTVGGFPFTSRSGNYTAGNVIAQNYTGGAEWLSVLSLASADYVVFQEQGSDAQGTEFANGYLIFSISYEVA